MDILKTTSLRAASGCQIAIHVPHVSEQPFVRQRFKIPLRFRPRSHALEAGSKVSLKSKFSVSLPTQENLWRIQKKTSNPDHFAPLNRRVGERTLNY